MSLFNKKKLILDLTPTSIGVALIDKDSIEYSSRKYFDTNSDLRSANLDIFHLLKKEKILLEELFSIHFNKLQVFVFLHTPFTKISPNKVSKQFDRDYRLNNKTLRNVFSCKKDKQNTDVISLFFINKVISNGYELDNPDNIKVKSMNILFIESIIEDKYKIFLENILSVFGVNKHVQLFDYTTALFSVAPKDSLQDYIIMDFTETHTRMLVIKNKEIKSNISADFGTEHLLDTVVRSLNINKTQARAKLQMYKDGTLTPFIKKQLNTAIGTFERELTSFFNQYLQVAYESSQSLPARVYLSAPEYIRFFIKNTITSTAFSKFTLSGTLFKVGEIVPDIDLYQDTTMAKDSRFTFEFYFANNYPQVQHKFIVCK